MYTHTHTYIYTYIFRVYIYIYIPVYVLRVSGEKPRTENCASILSLELITAYLEQGGSQQHVLGKKSIHHGRVRELERGRRLNGSM